MDLRINTTPAKIGIDKTPHNLKINNSSQADFDMNIKQAAVKLDFDQIMVEIDQYQCFAETGLKNYADLTKEYVNISKQKAMETISKTVSEGRQIKDTRDARRAISSIARQNYFAANKADLTVEALPRTRPSINFTGGDVNIEYDQGVVESNFKANKAEINFSPAKVEVYLTQKSKVNVEFIGNNMDMMI